MDEEDEDEEQEQELAAATHSSLAGELSLPVVSLSQQEEEDSSLAMALEAVSQLASLAPASSAVTDILAELSSGESTDSSSQGGDELSQEDVEDSPEVPHNFPIFYRETARSGEGSAPAPVLQPGKRFLCKTLGPDQVTPPSSSWFLHLGSLPFVSSLLQSCSEFGVFDQNTPNLLKHSEHLGTSKKNFK